MTETTTNDYLQKSIDEFVAAALKLEHVTGCAFERKGAWVQFEVEAYLANEDGSAVERGRNVMSYTCGQISCHGTDLCRWALSSFERAIAEKWQGYTRYATPQEIEVHQQHARHA